MGDPNGMAPAELKAYMQSGGEWGTWGSVKEHGLYVMPIPKNDRRRQRCSCGCGKRSTHRVFANGVCMGEGCEMQMHRVAKARHPTPR